MKFHGCRSEDEFLWRLEHARTAWHPYLGAVHVYGMIPFGDRYQYYRRLHRLLHVYGLTWAWSKYIWCLHVGKQGHRKPPDPDKLRVEAEALDWIYKPKAEVYVAPPPTAIKVFYQARREAVVPSYGGTWPL